MAKHGIYISEQATSVSTPVVAESGIPFVIGSAPIQSAESPAGVGVPVLCTSWAEAIEKLGYSDDWEKYGICEFMYSHFQLFGCQPAIFCNLLNPVKMNEAVAADDMAVTNHKITLPLEAINDKAMIVKASGGAGSAYIKDADYAVYYDDGSCVIELLEDGSIYTATSLNVAYSKVDTAAVSAKAVATGLEAIELCMGKVGIVPDIICAPGFSGDTGVGAVMATKAGGINGMFNAKALIDLSTDEIEGAADYSAVVALKNSGNFVDENEIVCWPMLKLGDKKFHMSTQLAGLMAKVDNTNNGCPYESPSNKSFKCDSIILDNGAEVPMTLAQANILNSGGVVTALGFMGGIVCWGNYTSCYPTNTDVKDYFIPISRVFDWVGKTEIYTFWGKLDKPMNRRLIATILDTINIWFNGLTGMGYILGGRAEFLEAENPLTGLMAGIMRIHNYITPPSPAQEIDFILEYDVSYVTSALQG